MKRSKRIPGPWSLTLLTAFAVSPAYALERGPSALSKPQVLHSLSSADIAEILHDRPMSLDDALRISFLASRQLGSALNAYVRARGAVREANSAFLPRIGFGAQAVEFDRANIIDLGTMMGGSSLPLTIANRWNPLVMAGLTMQIDISGAIRSASNQSEFMALASRIDVDRVRNQLALEVRSAYYQVLRAHGLKQVAEDNLAAAKLRLHDAMLNESVGNAPKFDVVSAQRDVADADQGVVAARSQESISISVLKNVTGIDQSTQFSIEFVGLLDSTIDGDPAPATKSAAASSTVTDEMLYGPEYNSMVAEALKRRPEILESQAAVEAYKHGIRYARRSMMPALLAGLDYNSQPNNGAFTLQRSAVASLSLSIPIFDGGLARAKVEQAEADKSESESNYRGAVDQVKMEVQNAYVQLAQARSRIAMADAGLKQAQEAYRLAQERYCVGVSKSSVVSPQLELSSAVAALTLSKTNRVNAFIDLNFAEANLDHALGKFALPPAARPTN